MSNSVRVPVRIGAVPEAIAKVARNAMRSASVQVDLARGGAVEVASWGSCKLMAEKSGAVTRYYRQHYGVYQCCKDEMLRQSGLAPSGVGSGSLPVWAALNLGANAPAWFWRFGKSGRLVRLGYEVLTWHRTSTDAIRAHVRDQDGFQWVVFLRRNNFLGVNPNGVTLMVGNRDGLFDQAARDVVNELAA